MCFVESIILIIRLSYSIKLFCIYLSLAPGSCDSLTMKAKLVGGNPGRLTYSWEVEQEPGQPNSSHMVAVLATMRSILSGLPSDTTEWTMTANQTMFTGVNVIFSVKVRNFLNTESVGIKTVLREMKELPQVQMATSALTTKVSLPISLRGKNDTIFIKNKDANVR